MGIKELFDKGETLKLLKDRSQDSFREDVESPRFIDAYIEKRDRFRPDVDFTTASNFARFGLAELYYENSIKRIYQTYPYDGSLAEKTEWENNSTYLDLFIFENEYPRTNGYIKINSTTNTYTDTAEGNFHSSSAPQYVYFKGGPSPDSGKDYKSNLSAGPSRDGISKANIYHTASQRTNNLEFDLSKGSTIEFWMKKDAWVSTTATKYETIFNLISSGAAGSTFGNVKAMMRGGAASELQSRIRFMISSGSSVVSHDHETGLSNISGSGWHHYALTAKKVGTSTQTKLYVDGQLKSVKTAATEINPITGALVATIGALAGPSNSALTTAEKGWGNIISTSFDEFRYWKTERNAQQIGRYYRAPVDGGTNTDNIKYDKISNKVDLGIYYKFNEGVTGIASTDKNILDYSGRISNGEFINYTSANRSTDSAIVLAGAASKEFKDPILYSFHPSVDNFFNSKKASGSMHDHTNFTSIYKSMPGWILEEDEEKSNHLKQLCQIMASYFDNIFLQIEKVPRLKDINYPFDSKYESPLPFADRLLSDRGYDAPELFSDASMLAKYLERDERRLFEKKLHDVKNTIYQNIYNNLTYIQKTKGTAKSLRNFLRCFGIDEELVKLNIYASNDQYELKDNYTTIAYKKKYLDFDDPETRLLANKYNYDGAYSATAYQFKDPADANSISYIPGIHHSLASGSSFTLQAEIFFPKRTIAGDDNYSLYPSTQVSLFGLNAVKASDTDFAFHDENNINFNVIALKPDYDKRNVKFSVVSRDSTDAINDITTPNTYTASYDNEKWNLAFRLRPTRYPNAPMVTGSLTGSLLTENNGYTYELYGVNYSSDVFKNEFIISGTMSTTNAMHFFNKPKRVFCGAYRNNYTGSVIRNSDVKISSVRAWFDYLSNDAVKGHAKDASNYGALNPFKNRGAALTSGRADIMSQTGPEAFQPQIKTLALNWTMQNVTGSDNNGRFIINDFTSGSASRRTSLSYGPLSSVTEYSYTGRGDYFVSASAYQDQAVDIEFVQTARQNLPEVVNSDDMVQILNKQDDVVFTRETTYVQHLLSVEKSMYQVISDEMLRMFSTIVDFNNLIGDPANRYRINYKKMEKIRDIFFENVENTPDLDKFIEFYKWIDDAVSAMITQLIPASSNTTEMLRNMVESHILERNKYWTKFPTLSLKQPPLQASMKGIGNLPYNQEVFPRISQRGDIDAMRYSSKGWKFLQPAMRQSPAPQNVKVAWWKARAERDVAELSSSVEGINDLRNTILKTAQTLVSSSEPTFKTSAGTKYASSFFNVRSISPTAHYNVRRSYDFKAGSNPRANNNHDFYKSVIKWGSDDDFIYIDVDYENKRQDIRDQVIPPEIDKKLFIMKAYSMFSKNPSEDFVPAYDDFKSTLLLPFSMYSSSINGGYISQFQTSSINIDFTNMHEDKYGPHAEIPMQGPFTEKYVGGMQHRHVDINRHDVVVNANGANKLDTPMTRPEGWYLRSFLNTNQITYLVREDFEEATSTATTDTRIFPPAPGSAMGDPSEEEYWRNGVNSDNSWLFFSGSTPSSYTGPTGASVASTGYAYCEVTPSDVNGKTYGLVTPLVDLLDIASDDQVVLSFNYHMYGIGQGNLKVQICESVDFSSGVTDLDIYWYEGATTSTTLKAVGSITGQQQTSAVANWRKAITTANAGQGNSLNSFVGKRFYIRFLYTTGILHTGDCAIDNIEIYKVDDPPGSDRGIEQNSFKLLDPTYDNHHRPRAVYTRQDFAKRPVNIRNIHMTGNTPTKAGNFLNRYEYVNVVSPEANDPWFVKNAERLSRTNSETINLDIASINRRLGMTANPASSGGNTPRQNTEGDLRRDGETSINFTLLDRTFLTGTVRNRTRINTKFSSPGGFEVMSRGFLDVEHETYSVYNVMTWRNSWPRRVYNSQLQSHCGQYGVSKHNSDSSRVYDSEQVGAIRAADYSITGDAAKHKYHRNNIEKVQLSGSAADFNGMTVITASSYDNAFISHMIPRTDNQTRWITASLN